MFRRPDRPACRRAFTLTEILIVIAILAILAGALLPAIFSAVCRGREAAVIGEFHIYATALQAFKAQYGTYPPSRLLVCEDGDYRPGRFPAPLRALATDSYRELHQLFPKLRISMSGPTWEIHARPTTTDGAKSQWFDWNGDDRPAGIADDGTADGSPTYSVLEGDQCLVLFLGGIAAPDGQSTHGMGRDPRNPIVPYTELDGYGAGPSWHAGATVELRTSPYLEIASDRLRQVADGGPPGVIDLLDRETPMPYAYFRVGTLGYVPPEDPEDPSYRFRAGNHYDPRPTRDGAVPYLVGDGSPPTWQRGQTFQLVCAGYDRLFSDDRDAENLPVPAVPRAIPRNDAESLPLAHQDNLTNFSGRALGR